MLNGKRITQVVPDAEYHFQRAMEAQGKEVPDAILASFDRALASHPGHVIVLNEKGNYLDQLGRLDEAITCYNTALDMDPGSAEVWFNKGLTLKKLGKEAEATSCIRKGIDLALG